jgi:hypothetical protein
MSEWYSFNEKLPSPLLDILVWDGNGHSIRQMRNHAKCEDFEKWGNYRWQYLTVPLVVPPKYAVGIYEVDEGIGIVKVSESSEHALDAARYMGV